MDVADPQDPVSLENAVSLTGEGRFHWTLQVVCGLCVTGTVVEVLSTGYIMPTAQCDLHLNTQEMGVLNSMCWVGMISSSHLWGYVADTRGRRYMLLLTLLGDSVCTVLSSFSHAYWLMALFRFCNGFLLSGPGAVISAYLGEFHRDKTRSRAIVWLGFFIAVGFIALPGLAWLVIPQASWRLELPGMSYGPWRIFLVLCTLPILTSALCIWLLLPESPKFLLAVGEEQRALTVLRKMYATNTGKDPLSYPALSLRQEEAPLQPADGGETSGNILRPVLRVAKSMWRQTAPLFKPPHLRHILITCLFDFGIFTSCNGLLMWLPELFSRVASYHDAHPEQKATLTVCEAVEAASAEPRGAPHSWPRTLDRGDNDKVPVAPELVCTDEVNTISFRNTLAIGTATGVAYIFAGYIVPFTGKKRILVVSTFLCGGCGVALHWATSPELVLTLACFFIAPSNMCISVMNSVVVDLFPTQERLRF